MSPPTEQRGLSPSKVRQLNTILSGNVSEHRQVHRFLETTNPPGRLLVPRGSTEEKQNPRNELSSLRPWRTRASRTSNTPPRSGLSARALRIAPLRVRGVGVGKAEFRSRAGARDHAQHHVSCIRTCQQQHKAKNNQQWTEKCHHFQSCAVSKATSRWWWGQHGHRLQGPLRRRPDAFRSDSLQQ